MTAMLSRRDFFSLVLPTTGKYCVVGLGATKKTKQVFVDSLDEVDNYAEALVHKGYDAYFALASFKTDESRTVPNSDALSSFFLDIDCGAGKPYEDQNAGIAALKKFVKDTNLPKPSAIVNSGRGIHVYWALNQALPTAEWKPIAEGLKALCVKHGLDADASVTADAARILRMPDTLNFKNPDAPLPTKTLMAGAKVDSDKIKEVIPAAEFSFDIPGSKPFMRQMDPMTLALMGNYQSNFKTIMLKSVKGEGCMQLVNAYQNQDSLEEPLWRGALSIANHCVDADTAIHKLSNKHPDYSESRTIKKANETKGPYTCETFKKLNPSGCEGCELKVTSPIQIGREIVEATEEERTVTAVEATTKEEVTYTIPQFPFPFFRGRVGGVYRRADPNIEDDKDQLIYPYDFYIVKRIHDPEDGETLLARLHLPKDGVREFVMPLNAVLSKEKFVNTIAQHGMAVLGKKQELLMGYVTRWVEELQALDKSEIARRQFGWLDDNSAFIVGDREIQSTGAVVYSPPTGTTLPLIPIFQPKGDFHTWKDIINAYAREEMQYRAFAFFMGFGGPLMKFMGGGMLDGFLLNLVSQKGGSGKTTLLFAINSIYGRPKELLLSYKDTHNHRLQRLGAMQSMTPTIDELTNMEPKAMSNLVYDITSGKGKNRLQSKANAERANHSTWQIPVVSSSNRRIKDALMSIKGFPDAELLRILEVEVPRDTHDDPTWSKTHFGRLMQNYGHAVDPYIKYVSTNLPTVVTLLDKVSAKLDRRANIKNTERYWSAGIAIAITGGIIAKDLGLHDIPIEPVFQYAVDLVKQTRAKNDDDADHAADRLGLFLQTHYQDILVINGNKDKRTGIEMGPIKEPRGKVVARYEPDTKMLFICNSTWREDCAKAYAGYDDSLIQYKKSGAFVELKKKKRMLAGTVAGASAGVSALVFDTTKLDFFPEDALLNAPAGSED